MRAWFRDVQRIVLKGDRWALAQHVVLGFAKASAPQRFLQRLHQAEQSPHGAHGEAPPVQISLGFSRRGLAHAGVREHVLACFAAKAPAFHAGAALRAASELGYCGADAPARWHACYDFNAFDAVISFHSNGADKLKTAVDAVEGIARESGVEVTFHPLQMACRFPAPDGDAVHFGFRDGLSRLGIRGWTEYAEPRDRGAPDSWHAPGEFVLGHPQDCGANPWLGAGNQRPWPKALRSFFTNGSFGVLAQIEQHVDAFESYVGAQAAAIRTARGDEVDRGEADDVKAWLCGRTPAGRPLAAARGAADDATFNFEKDPQGHVCPFGSHVRRMNPRGGEVALSRTRALLRRGLPYGPMWTPRDSPRAKERGLFGQFFCASIEDQFEHLVGRWANRVPMGSPDGGTARDPLIGAHEPGDGAFEVPRESGGPLWLAPMPRLTTVRGLAYLFYPSVSTVQRIADSEFFVDFREDDE